MMAHHSRGAALTLDWGSVPGFLSLAVSFWALVQSRRTAKQQRRSDLQDQARFIVVSPLHVDDAGLPPGKVRVRIAVHNCSDYPLTDVCLRTRTQLISSTASVWDFRPRLGVDEEFVIDEVVDAAPDPYPLPVGDRYRVMSNFVDHNGHHWQRWATGEISPTIDIEAQSALHRLLYRTLPKPLIDRWLRRKNRPAVRARLP
jgi:hypothetical protein